MHFSFRLFKPGIRIEYTEDIIFPYIAQVLILRQGHPADWNVYEVLFGTKRDARKRCRDGTKYFLAATVDYLCLLLILLTAACRINKPRLQGIHQTGRLRRYQTASN